MATPSSAKSPTPPEATIEEEGLSQKIQITGNLLERVWSRENTQDLKTLKGIETL